MVAVEEFVAGLLRKGVRLWIESGRIRYRAGKGSLTHREREEIAARKVTILELLEKSAPRAQQPAIPRRCADAKIPLSFAQERLWFLDRLSPDAGAAYHLGRALSLYGALDAEVLQWSLNRIVERHEALRTVFVSESGRAQQEVLEGCELRLRWRDLSELEGAQREARITAEAQEERTERFDLSSAPLIRGRLLKLAEQQHVLLLTMHHIVSDGWSIGVFLRELSELYASRIDGRPVELPELPVQYADYALWQRQWLQGEQLERQLGYWRKQLENAPLCLNLPASRARPPAQSYRGETFGVRLGEELSEQLKGLSKRRGMTLFMTLYAGFAVLLWRLSAQEDVVIGTPVANRPAVELERLIGLFVNTLALRLRVRADQSVVELLELVKKTTLEGYEHQETPFERVVDELKPHRSLSHNPIVQVMFAFQQSTSQGLLRLGDVKLGGQEQAYVSGAQFDLSLALREVGKEIFGGLNYATDLFDRETVERWAEYYKEVLWGLVRAPSGRVGELSLLPPQERARILREFNTTPVLNTVDRCLHELFEEQVERTPDAVAVVYEEQSLTYAQLNARANRLARYLQSQGVSADQRVGLCTQRSPEMVIGLLGILKSGGAYVPLDAGYPGERQRYVLQDAQPVVLVVTSAHSEVAQRSRALGVPVVELGEAEVQRQSTANLDGRESTAREAGARERAARAHTLAYLIYTSGSTGEPKGVMVEHAQVVRLFESTRKWFEFGSTDVWTLFHSVSFDFSVWELWGALLFGGRLVVVPQLIARSPQEFYELLCRQGVTVLNQTPSAFRQLIAAQGQVGDRAKAGGHALRRVILGGEALDPGMLKALVRASAEDAPG